MIAIWARLNVAAGKESDFEAVMLELAANVREKETKNHLYTLIKDDEGYSVMELYEDDAALAEHQQSEHFRAAGPKFAGLMAGAPVIKRYEVVGP